MSANRALRVALPAVSLLLALGAAGPVLGQADDLRLVRDINTESFPLSSSPYPLDVDIEKQPVVIAGVAYFPADDGVSGVELWRSDGTAAGTALVRDINPVGGSRVQQLTVVGTTLFFVADDGTSGLELWSSDGTEAGTLRVQDINPDSGSSPAELTPVNGELFFVADDGASGRELWRSDGTGAGTVLVRNLNGTAENSNIGDLEALGTTLFFRADDGTGTGPALWRWTAAGGMALVADTDPAGTDSTFPRGMTASGTRLFFVGEETGGSLATGTGRELWVHIPGPGAGATVRLSDIFPGPTPGDANIPVPGISSPVDAGGTLFFKATDDTATAPGVFGNQELHTSNGTPAGTVEVEDLNGDDAGLPLGVREPPLLPLGTSVFFRATDGTGVRLATADGTAPIDFLTDPGTDPSDLVAVGTDVFFSAVNAASGRELWVSDGTLAGTMLVRDIDPGEDDGMAPLDEDGSQRVDLAGTLLFRADDGTTGLEPWRSDGTEAGTVLVADLRPGEGTEDSDPRSLAVFDGQVYFGAEDGDTGRELWRSDGTRLGTARVANLVAGAEGSDPQRLTPAAGVLFFTATTPLEGQELWRTDGTEAGTVLVRDIRSGIPGSQPRELAAIGTSRLYFSADDGVSGREPWVSRGSLATTSLLRNINPGGDSDPREFVALDGLVVFTADDGTGRQPWVTQVSTGISAEINVPGTAGSDPAELTVVGNQVFFRADDGTEGAELWVTSGTTFDGITVRQVEDIWPGPQSGFPRNLTAFDGRLFFSADDGVTGEELWVSDGTRDGTRLLAETRPGAEGSELDELTVVGERLFFVARNDAAGEELWVTDGTPSGTRLAADVRSGPGGSGPSRLTAVGEVLVFAADDGAAGQELWRFDAAGASRIGNINPDGGADIGPPVVLDDTVFFSADDHSTGDELWAATIVPRLGGTIGVGTGGAVGPWWLLGLAAVAALGAVARAHRGGSRYSGLRPGAPARHL